MAIFTFTDALGIGADMRAFDAYFDEASTTNATTLRFREGAVSITYSGSFAWKSGAPRGEIESLRVRVDGKDVLLATDLELDAAAFWRLIRDDDASGARGLLVSRSDTIAGTRFDDVLTGGAKRDILQGRAGDDRIWGGDGSDRLEGGVGADRMYGDAGNDRALGGAGRDRIWGGDGEDRLYGGGGDDRISGDAGADRLFGGKGDDRLTGGEGRDVLFGGAGADVFIFASRFDFAAADAPDLIGDFSQAEGDRIDLSAIDANTLKGGMQSFTFIGGKGFSGAGGELRFRDGQLTGDVQGDKRPDFVISVGGVDKMTADDFIL